MFELLRFAFWREVRLPEIKQSLRVRFFCTLKVQILSNFGISAFCVFEGSETARNQTESSRSFFSEFQRANSVEFYNFRVLRF